MFDRQLIVEGEKVLGGFVEQTWEELLSGESHLRQFRVFTIKGKDSVNHTYSVAGTGPKND
jgi:hypothetical protein